MKAAWRPILWGIGLLVISLIATDIPVLGALISKLALYFVFSLFGVSIGIDSERRENVWFKEVKP